MRKFIYTQQRIITRKNIFLYGLVVAACVFVVGNALRAVHTAPLHNDEISWFFHTEFFEELFIKKDIRSAMWQSYESYDHPQLSKYIYGAYVAWKYPKVFDVRRQLEGRWGRWNFYFLPDVEAIKTEYFAPYIYGMRQINIISIAGIIFAVCFILRMMTINMFVVFLGAILFVTNELFMGTTIRATSDGHMVLFQTVAFGVYLAYLKYGNRKFLLLAALATALSISAKLTGVLGIYAIMFSEFIHAVISSTYVKIGMQNIGLMGVIIFFVWCSMNPAVYTNPVKNSVVYFTFRSEQSVRLQNAFPDVALSNYREKIWAAYCAVLNPDCDQYRRKGYMFPSVVINVSLFLTGCFWFLAHRKDRKNRWINISFIIYAVLTIGIITLLLPFNSDRYFLPIQISVWMVQMVGISAIIKTVQRGVLVIRESLCRQ